MLNKTYIEDIVMSIFESCAGNAISEKDAITPELVGVEMFEAPLVGIGCAEDELYKVLKKDDVVGPWHMSPKEWLDE